MSNIIRIENISQLHQLMQYPKPKHPLVSVIDLSTIEYSQELIGTKMASAHYSIALKSKTATTILYGRGHYDFEDGTLLAFAPDQVIGIDEQINKGEMEGWALYFHPDLIRSYPLQNKMKQFGFFSYSTHEALHLSEKEKSNLTDIIKKIEEEYHQNIDEYSQDVLVGQIDVLLSYVQRYYSRQFITRKHQHSDTIASFEQLIEDYINSDQLKHLGTPSVSWCANQLNLSANYLGDLLKKETGQPPKEYIQQQIIELAKTRLIGSNKTVAEIAHELGYEYPYYFGRIFKKKTGTTPLEYRNQSSM